uniref:T-complex protein 1 subunit alpha n=1 Tax=Stygiella incarcerata TaxID=1712417 RepID=A0A192ZHU8_9EUKA|nr:T-complex protein 1 subunit alpha [Stygiella incarcerata]|eukprot:TRINITY_DN335_c0_g2_i3.p1 TRINITY_DN335_c0_g2~~TRINITY_DN335_c0_g2_i3.p1  ORF type:complete len:560 (-),score=192.41 TRINITY_DN335_c0_g2_i3:1931-3610(-)
MADQVAPLRLDGERKSGQDVRDENVSAALSVANVVKTSLGPIGLDKMLVDDIGDVTVTNDGATILRLLEIEHPAAKVLVDLAQLQDEEVGDGTTSVVIIASELLRRGNDLVKKKVHPTLVISGFRLAMKESIRYIRANLATPSEALGRECLMNIARTSISSKVIGAESEFFANLVVDAIQRVKTINSRGDYRYPVKAVNILKQHGRSMRETMHVHGFALNCTRGSQQMPSRITGAKIALLDFDLQRVKTRMGVQVLVTDPKELEAIRRREEDMTKERIAKIVEAGANVVLTTKGIDDFSLKFLVQKGVIGVRRVKKDDIRRIAKLTGGEIMLTLANLEGDESFDTKFLGVADEVSQERLADDELILIKTEEGSRATSIVLRGPNEYMLDEMERSVHDALCAVKRCLESGRVVPGGGCVETALSIHLEEFATTIETKEQLAIAEFAEALLVIPKQLAVNAAKDATELVAKLRAHHYLSQSDESKADHKYMGLDLVAGVVRDNLAAGVLEPAMSKVKSIQFATEAAIALMRIDDFVRINPKQQQQQQGGGMPGGMPGGMMM